MRNGRRILEMNLELVAYKLNFTYNLVNRLILKLNKCALKFTKSVNSHSRARAHTSLPHFVPFTQHDGVNDKSTREIKPKAIWRTQARACTQQADKLERPYKRRVKYSKRH